MLTQLFLVMNLGVYFLSSKTTAWQVEEERGAEGDRHESPIDLIHGIYPGTKWCGWGNIAQDEDDLGEEAATDACCRTHDHCPYYILAHSTKDGFYNTLPFTASSCHCDERLFDCLKAVKTTASNGVGEIFFGLDPLLFCVKEPAPGAQCCKKYFLWRCVKWEEGTCASRSDLLRMKWNRYNSVAEIKEAEGKQQRSKRVKAKSKSKYFSKSKSSSKSKSKSLSKSKYFSKSKSSFKSKSSSKSKSKSLSKSKSRVN